MAYQPKSYRKFLATGVATAMVATTVAPAVSADQHTDFTDIEDVRSWAGDAIDYLVEKGAIQGMGTPGIFNPQGELTRGQAASLLANTLGLDVDEDATSGFDDLAGHWSDAYVAAIQAELPGVIDGYTDGTFRPETDITRQEMAKITVEAFDLEVNADADVDFEDNNSWGAEYVEVLASLGILGGYTDGTIRPEADITRAEAAVFVHRTEVPSVRLGQDEVAELAVESVSAINDTSFTVNFEDALDEDMSVEDVGAGLNVLVTLADGTEVTPEVTELTISEDRESVTVEHANDPLDGLAGTLTVNGFDLEFDYTALEVTNVSAMNGDESVDLDGMPGDGHIVIEFNRDVDEDSLVEGLVFEDEVGAITDFEVEVDGNQATVEFGSNLVNDTEYTMTLSDIALADDEDNGLEEYSVDFTTGSFLLVESVLFDGSTDAVQDNSTFSDITVETNIDIDLASVTTTNVRVYNKTDETYVSVRGTVEDNELTIERTNGNDFLENKSYRVELQNLESLSGFALPRNLTYDFALGTQPSVSSVSTLNTGEFAAGTTTVFEDITYDDKPVYGASSTAILKNSAVGDIVRNAFTTTIAFDSRMDESTIHDENIYIEHVDSGEKADINVDYNVDTRRATITLEEDLEELAKYKLVVTEDVTNEVGIAFDEEDVRGFVTKALTPVTIESVTPANRASGVSVDDNIEIKFSHKLDAVPNAVTTAGERGIELYNLDTETVINLSGQVQFKQDEDGNDIEDIVEIDVDGLAGWTQGERYRVRVTGEEDSNTASEIPSYAAQFEFEEGVTADTQDVVNYLNNTFTSTFTLSRGQVLSLTNFSNELDNDGEELINVLDISNVNNDLSNGDEVHFEFGRTLKADGVGSYTLFDKITFEKWDGSSWQDATADFDARVAGNTEIGRSSLEDNFLTVEINDSNVDETALYRMVLSEDLEDNQDNKLGDDIHMLFNMENANFNVDSTDVGYYDDETETFADDTDISANNNFSVTDGTDGLNAIQLTITNDGGTTLLEEKDLDGVNEENIYLLDDEGNQLTGEIVVLNDNEFTLVLDSSLQSDEDYQVVVDGVRTTFSVKGADKLAHELPETNVYFGTGTLTMSEISVDSANFTANSIQQTDKVFELELSEERDIESDVSLFETNVPANTVDVDVDIDGTSVTVTPIGYLDASTQYTLKVDGSTHLVDGQDFERQFSTSSTQKTVSVNDVNYNQVGDDLVVDVYFSRNLVTAVGTLATTSDFTAGNTNISVFDGAGVPADNVSYSSDMKRLRFAFTNFYDTSSVVTGETVLTINDSLLSQRGYNTTVLPEGSDDFDIEVDVQ